MIILSDNEIQALIIEEKNTPDGLYPIKQMTERHQHKRKNLTLTCQSGHEFVIAIRQSALNMMDFSVILGYQLPGSFRIFRLRRYNGNSHQHTNLLENETLDGFHIHTATERYQSAPGFKEDHFAAVTKAYYDLNSAIQCFLVDCGFRSPLDESPLFRGHL